MADPITLIGTAGAAANIVQVLSSTITSLFELHQQWKDTDFVFMNLAGQFVALKLALTKIQEWMESEPAELHHQLIMDLDLSLTCCQMLLGKMNVHLSDLRCKDDGRLDTASRIRLITGGKPMQELQKMVKRQTNALSLVLIACNWYYIYPRLRCLEPNCIFIAQQSRSRDLCLRSPAHEM